MSFNANYMPCELEFTYLGILAALETLKFIYILSADQQRSYFIKCLLSHNICTTVHKTTEPQGIQLLRSVL